MPKVSIITPIYCDTPEKVSWLNEMIGSVIRQTLTDWELILIDDKSPQSLDSVKQHVTDNRLRWLENATNEGPARTRNTAVAIAESRNVRGDV
jgi:glycosyltransferase involved in cell wall biosynthesis